MSNLPLSIQSIEVAVLAEDGCVESPLDLPLLFQACVHRLRERHIDGSTTADDVNKLTLAIFAYSSDTTGCFDSRRNERFRSRMLSLARPRSVLQQSKEYQSKGALREVESAVIVMAMISAWMHLEAPRTFLSQESFPDISRPEREALSVLFFWTDVVLRKRKSAFQWWHLSLAVAAAAFQEIESRLAQHPTSHDVYTLVSQDSAAALNALVKRVGRRTRDLNYRDNLKDEKDSELLLHIWTEIVSKHRNSGNSIRPTRARHFETLWLAMDGKFNILPLAVRNRFIDSLRSESAKKRGGKVAAFLSLSLDGEPESDRPSDGDAPSPRSTGKALIEHKSRDVWKRVTYDRQMQDMRKLMDDPKVVKQVGPAMKLLRFHLEHPEEDGITDEQLAKRLGVKDRTIRNYRKRLEPLLKS